MSDRFVLHADKQVIESEFGVSTERDDYFEPNYNISPGTLVPAIYEDSKQRKIRNFYWGLIPEDAGEEREGMKNINVPMSELTDGGQLAEEFEKRRCIVPANGFFKWKTSKKKSTPFYIRLLSNDVMGMAAIYSIWESDSGRNVYSFTLLTTESNALVQPVGNRMPVILRPQHYEPWLSKGSMTAGILSEILKPYLLTEMAVNRVSEEVNNPHNEGPELIQPIPK